MKARISIGAQEVTIDLARPISLARPVDFTGSEPRHFGAPPPTTQPCAAPGFSGAVATGASCNCSTITLTPHCHGTHTECVGHLTAESQDAWAIIPAGLLPALLVTVEAVDAGGSVETTDPKPKVGDRLIASHSIARQWPANGPFEPRALIIRTRAASGATPYLSRETAQLLVARGIEHVVVDLPSLDRAQDEGRLTAHRIFFGLPGGSHALADAKRAGSTVTELASIPQALADGWYLLQIQAPAIAGDAVPCRPLIYSPL